MNRNRRLTEINGVKLDSMNDATLAYTLAALSEDDLKRVPLKFIRRWEVWQRKQSKYSCQASPTHC